MITRCLHKTQEFIYAEVSFEMVRDASGQMIGSMAIGRDATARFNEEKALRKQLADLTAAQTKS